MGNGVGGCGGVGAVWAGGRGPNVDKKIQVNFEF